MRRKLIIEYEGTETLATTLIESAIKEIHESPNGRLISLNNIDSLKDELDVMYLGE